jgi:hypothetical protein
MGKDRGGRANRVVRPYAITGGRLRLDQDEIEVEALVTTTSMGANARQLSFERRSIAMLCRDVLSIAEIAARLRLPLGVVRLLVSDMADQHLVEVHRPARFDDRPPDLSLLERVLYGLRQI